MRPTNYSKPGSPRLAAAVIALLCATIPCIVLFAGCSGSGNAPSSETAGSAVESSQAAIDAINLSSLPDSLVEKLEKYPETAEFAAAYEQEHNKHHEIDLTGDYTPGEIPFLLQWDVRWGYEMYGEDMIGINGCGPTCLSMVLVGLTGNTAYDPLTVANFAEQNGYYCSGAGSYFSLMDSGAAQLGLYSEELPLDETVIRSHLQGGDPIICVVGEGDFTTGSHFIVLTGVNADGTITLHDPNSRINSQKSWDLQRVMSQISNLWAFSVAGG